MQDPPRFDRNEDRSWRPIALEPLPEELLVSVLLTNYNYAKFLDEAIASVVAQTYPRFELIAVDDGSTDGSAEILKSWSARDPRVEALLRPNRGIPISTNEAFAVSAGEVICFLDSDDVFLPAKLERLVAAFRRDPVGYIHHVMRKLGSEGSTSTPMPRFGSLDRGIVATEVWRQGGRWRRAVTSGIALRREVADVIMPIPEGFTQSSDGYLCMMVPLVTTIGAIDDTLSFYRIHGENLAGRSDLDAARFRMQHIVDAVSTTNARLKELGVGRQIELDRNLSYHEQGLLICALGGERYFDTVRRYGSFIERLGQDPIFTPREKLALTSLYGVMVALPMHRREWWLSAAREGSLRRWLRYPWLHRTLARTHLMTQRDRK